MATFDALSHDTLLLLLELGGDGTSGKIQAKLTVGLALGIAGTRKDWSVLVRQLLKDNKVWAKRAYDTAVHLCKMQKKSSLDALYSLCPIPLSRASDADLSHVMAIHEWPVLRSNTVAHFVHGAFQTRRPDTREFLRDTRVEIRSKEALNVFVWLLEEDMLQFLSKAADFLSLRVSHIPNHAYYESTLLLQDLRNAAKQAFACPSAFAGEWSPSWSFDSAPVNGSWYWQASTAFIPVNAHAPVVAALAHRAGIPKFSPMCVWFIWCTMVVRAKRLLTKAALIATCATGVGQSSLVQTGVGEHGAQYSHDNQWSYENKDIEPVYDDEALESASECSDVTDSDPMEEDEEDDDATRRWKPILRDGKLVRYTITPTAECFHWAAKHM